MPKLPEWAAAIAGFEKIRDKVLKELAEVESRLPAGVTLSDAQIASVINDNLNATAVMAWVEAVRSEIMDLVRRKKGPINKAPVDVA